MSRFSAMLCMLSVLLSSAMGTQAETQDQEQEEQNIYIRIENIFSHRLYKVDYKHIDGKHTGYRKNGPVDSDSGCVLIDLTEKNISYLNNPEQYKFWINTKLGYKYDEGWGDDKIKSCDIAIIKKDQIYSEDENKKKGSTLVQLTFPDLKTLYVFHGADEANFEKICNGQILKTIKEQIVSKISPSPNTSQITITNIAALNPNINSILNEIKQAKTCNADKSIDNSPLANASIEEKFQANLIREMCISNLPHHVVKRGDKAITEAILSYQAQTRFAELNKAQIFVAFEFKHADTDQSKAREVMP